MARSVNFRLDLFFERMKIAPCASSPDTALELIGRILDQVEDEHSGVAKNADPMWTLTRDGRMYPPKECFICRDGMSNAKTAETSGHLIKLGADGSIEIFHKVTETLVFRKTGQI